MQKHKRRKHVADKRALVVANEHRPFFEATPGGKNAVAKLDGAVTTQAARISEMENYQSQQQQAAERSDKARRILTKGLRHVTKISNFVPDDAAPAFDTTRPGNDEQLIGRVEAVIAGASAHTDAFVNEGLRPGVLDTLTSELAAFRKAKDSITLSAKLFTEASAGLDRALAEGDAAIAVLDSMLEESPDAPVGALAAFRSAKLIGPRDVVDGAASAAGEPATPTGPAPAGPTPAPTQPAEPPVIVPNKVA